MKKTSAFLVLLLLMVTALSFVSCTKDKVDNSDSDLLIGKWELIKEGKIVDGKEILIEVKQDNCGTNKLEFNADKTGVLRDNYYDNNKCVEEIDSFTWEKKGTILTDTTEGFSLEIVELTSTVLKLKASEEGEVYIGLYNRI